MGESWGDLTAAEYMFEHGYSNGASPWAVGPYATGNKTVGIRDYAIDANPLNYSDYGFDSTGDEVHADGEIWNGTMWEVRKALVAKYDARLPEHRQGAEPAVRPGDRHAARPTPAARCPGNRRWLQLMFDAFLLQQGATSMLDARDAMLAADRMRFGGANQTVLWDAFARRGMGSNASTPDADSGDPKPGFASPRTHAGHGRRSPRPARPGTAAPAGKVYVGDYEARATPVADIDHRHARCRTRPSSRRAPTSVLGRGPGLRHDPLDADGHRRPEPWRRRFAVTPNLASAKNGAKVLGSSAGSLNAGVADRRHRGDQLGGRERGRLGGRHEPVGRGRPGRHRRRARSARCGSRRCSVRPRPGPTDGRAAPRRRPTTTRTPGRGSPRCAASRSRCVRRAARPPTATWKRIYTSAADAFPGVAPRPVAPNLTLRTFDVPDTAACRDAARGPGEPVHRGPGVRR